LPVMPLYTVTDRERVGQMIGGNRRRSLCQQRLRQVPILRVVGHQEFVYLRVVDTVQYIPCCSQLRDKGVQIVGLAFKTYNGPVAPPSPRGRGLSTAKKTRSDQLQAVQREIGIDGFDQLGFLADQ